MLGLAGLPLGLRFRFLDPGERAPAAIAGPVTTGALTDVGAARTAAAGASVVTYEWEGVPAEVARAVEELAPVWPPPIALEVSQDRVIEKQACAALGIATAPFRAVDTRAELDAAVAELGL